MHATTVVTLWIAGQHVFAICFYQIHRMVRASNQAYHYISGFDGFLCANVYPEMVVSWNRGAPKSSIFMGFSLTTTIHFGYPHFRKPANIQKLTILPCRLFYASDIPVTRTPVFLSVLAASHQAGENIWPNKLTSLGQLDWKLHLDLALRPCCNLKLWLSKLTTSLWEVSQKTRQSELPRQKNAFG